MVLVLQRKNSFIHPAKSMVIYDVPGAGNKTDKVPTCTELHSSGRQQTENNKAIHRIHGKGMCPMDKSKAQKGKNKEGSSVRVGQGRPPEQVAFD